MSTEEDGTGTTDGAAGTADGATGTTGTADRTPRTGGSAAVAALLAPFRDVLAAPGAPALAAALLTESLAHCGCDRGASWHAGEAVFTTVFELHASPADADPAEHLTVGRYIALFFLVEDGPPEEARALADRIRAGTGYGDGEAARALRVLLADLRDRGLPTGRLTALVAEFCAATAAEAAGPPPPGRAPVPRAETIGARPHIECWRLLRALPPPAPGSSGHAFAEATVEAVYLANDLLSAAVEERAGGRAAAGNTVLARARATGDRAGAVESAVTRYNTLVATLAAERHRPLPALLGELVDGNLRGHLALAGVRYPGLPLDVLGRLRTVAETGRP
ncbi:hypothetical protein ACIPYS_02825 [Kitasatospora sp. NPDC089913]|uniref:hypothetical protein n=1 Tax=Kitasatospora sp. NPDC089913 TaxID=3364080 RepID=UPI0037F94572